MQHFTTVLICTRFIVVLVINGFTHMDKHHNSTLSSCFLLFPIVYASRQAPTDLLCSKAFLTHVLNESQRIDGLGIITFS